MQKKLIIIPIVTAATIIGLGLLYRHAANATTSKPSPSGYTEHVVTSHDGTAITYITKGSGPGLIVAPGSLAVADDYTELGDALAQHYTVHIVDRRGHGKSGPQGDQYAITKEVEDILAVQSATGASYLVGHSFGGFVALETARSSKVFTRVALYEPGVSIDGSISTSWVAPAQQSMAAGKQMDTIVAFVKGTSPESAKTPNGLLKFILPLALKKDERQQMYDLMPTAIKEHEELARLNNTYGTYKDIQAHTLLMNGSKSAHTTGAGVEQLAKVIPAASIKTFDGLDHFGPDKGNPAQVGQAITTFFEEK